MIVPTKELSMCQGNMFDLRGRFFNVKYKDGKLCNHNHISVEYAWRCLERSKRTEPDRIDMRSPC